MSNAVTMLAVEARSDQTQLESLWIAVERLIGMWANKYHQNGETRLYDTDDLIQAGYLALHDTLYTFDPDKGEFTTYLHFHVRRRFNEVAGRHGTKIRPELDAVSLNTPLNEGEDISLVDTLADNAAEFADDVIERESQGQDCAALMAEVDKLPEEQRRALLLTSWDGLTVRDAAEAMEIPPEQVRVCRNKAAAWVRHTRTGRIMGWDYYYHVGLSRFKTTHTSAVEEIVLRAEWMEEYGQCHNQRKED